MLHLSTFPAKQAHPTFSVNYFAFHQVSIMMDVTIIFRNFDQQ